MKSVKDVLLKSSEFLDSKGVKSSRRQAEEILSDALSIPRLDLYMQFDRPLNDEELERCRENLARRAKGEPAQYIRGVVDFYGCEIEVNPNVLIPRNETEILVDKVAKEAQEGILWDICTGSGCIGIALKKKNPGLEVSLSDLSENALSVAQKNARHNEVEVEFFQGDLFEPFEGKKADFIVCNPPYIAENEYENLEVEVKNFEPKGALVSGKSGLEFYERIAAGLPKYLKPGGKVWLEIGQNQGNSLKSLFSDPIWVKKSVELDWAGHERFFLLEIE